MLIFHSYRKIFAGSIFDARQAGYNVDNKDNVKAVQTIIITSEINTFEGIILKKYTSGAKS